MPSLIYIATPTPHQPACATKVGCCMPIRGVAVAVGAQPNGAHAASTSQIFNVEAQGATAGDGGLVHHDRDVARRGASDLQAQWCG